MLPQAQMSPRSCVELDREVFEQTNIARRLIRRRPAGDRGAAGRVSTAGNRALSLFLKSTVSYYRAR